MLTVTVYGSRRLASGHSRAKVNTAIMENNIMLYFKVFLIVACSEPKIIGEIAQAAGVAQPKPAMSPSETTKAIILMPLLARRGTETLKNTNHVTVSEIKLVTIKQPMSAKATIATGGKLCVIGIKIFRINVVMPVSLELITVPSTTTLATNIKTLIGTPFIISLKLAIGFPLTRIMHKSVMPTIGGTVVPQADSTAARPGAKGFKNSGDTHASTTARKTAQAIFASVLKGCVLLLTSSMS